MDLADAVAEFRELDQRRTAGPLAPHEEERYQTLFLRLSDELSGNERRRQFEGRRSLRVLCKLEVVLRTSDGGERMAKCANFGGGGCAVRSAELFPMGSTVAIDGVLMTGIRYPLSCSAAIVWARPLTGGPNHDYGLQFAVATPEIREQVEHIFYRAVDLFLKRRLFDASSRTIHWKK